MRENREVNQKGDIRWLESQDPQKNNDLFMKVQDNGGIGKECRRKSTPEISGRGQFKTARFQLQHRWRRMRRGRGCKGFFPPPPHQKEKDSIRKGREAGNLYSR